jgi:hypothetical protein
LTFHVAIFTAVRVALYWTVVTMDDAA